MAIAPALRYTDTDSSASTYITNMPRKELPADIKDKVLNYLNNSLFHDFACGEAPQIDPFTGQQMWNCGVTFADGKYYWSDKLPLYVRDYNIELPADFVEHIMDFYASGGIVQPDYNWKTERIGPRVFTKYVPPYMREN